MQMVLSQTGDPNIAPKIAEILLKESPKVVTLAVGNPPPEYSCSLRKATSVYRGLSYTNMDAIELNPFPLILNPPAQL